MEDSEHKTSAALKLVLALITAGGALAVPFCTHYLQHKGHQFFGDVGTSSNKPAVTEPAPAVISDGVSPQIQRVPPAASSAASYVDSETVLAAVPSVRREPTTVTNNVQVPHFEDTDFVDYLLSEATGEGTDRRTALRTAITEAVSKRVGSRISDKAVLALQSLDTEQNGKTVDRIDQSLQSRYESATDGLIKWWDIRREEFDGLSYKVQIVAVLANIKSKPNKHPNRKTLAVLPFRVDGEVSLKGRAVSSDAIGKQFRESALTYLVNSRKFAVLDQTFDQELNKFTAEQPASDPVQRAIAAAKRLDAEYAVIGILSGFDISQRQIGGLEVPFIDGLVNFRIIQVDNRQTVLATAVAFADLLNVDLGGPHPETSLADAVGRTLADRTLETIYPFKVAGLNGTEEVILNRGGDDLSVGQRFDLCNLGQEIKDPSTGESLGLAERRVATIEVTRVLPKVAYAKVITRTEEIVMEAVCRKPQQAKTVARSQTPSVKHDIDNLFK